MNENFEVTGEIVGTGAALNEQLGFVPRIVELYNPTKGVRVFWVTNMGDGAGTKSIEGNAVAGNAGIVIGTASAAAIKLGASTGIYTVYGTPYATITTAEYAFTATVHDITAVAASVQEACYLLSANAAATVTITKGATATGAGNAVVPECPAGNVPIGFLRLAVAAGSTDFDASTDLLSAGHLTDTFTDLTSVSGLLMLSSGVSEYLGSAGTNNAGFSLGSDGDLNSSDGDTIYYKATR